MAILTVFVAGLMVGRTPEILGKKIGAQEMTYVALYTLSVPAIVLIGIGTAIALNSTPDAMGNPGGHGFSEVVYAFTSAANNNGSAFGGITVTSTFFQISLAVAMLLGRFVPIVLVLALAGSLAKQGKVPVTAGTLPTHTPLFAGLLVGVILLITGLTFFPALALGPLAEALVMTLTTLLSQLPSALRKLDPRHLWRSPVMFIVWIGSVMTTVIAIADPSAFAWIVDGLAVAHGRLRQPRRGRRRGPRQGAGRLAASRPHRRHGARDSTPTAPRRPSPAPSCASATA